MRRASNYQESTVDCPVCGEPVSDSIRLSVVAGKEEPRICADCVPLIRADQRTEGGVNQRLNLSGKQLNHNREPHCTNECSADWTVYGTVQYPSANPSLRGSEPPINVPLAGSIMIA
jgi:hypothetical protein